MGRADPRSEAATAARAAERAMTTPASPRINLSAYTLDGLRKRLDVARLQFGFALTQETRAKAMREIEEIKREIERRGQGVPA